MKERTIEIKVGNDNGNSTQKLAIQYQGDEDKKVEMVVQPNVLKELRKIPEISELEKNKVLSNYDNILVTITSTSLNQGVPTTYYVGNSAINCGRYVESIPVGAVNSKLNSQIPLVNTLGTLAFYSVKKTIELDGWTNASPKIETDIEMATALPVTQYTKENASNFSNNFAGKHEVIVWIGEVKFQVILNFVLVKTNPESVPVLFSMKEKTVFSNWSFFGINEPISMESFINEWEALNGEIKFMDGVNILHLSIGEGTTEIPLTRGLAFDPNFVFGSNNGAGHAIDAASSDFISKCNLAKLVRQDYSSILVDPLHKYHAQAWDSVDEYLEEQSHVICDNAAKEIGKANNNVDIICVHGGGALLMHEYLNKELARLQHIYSTKTLAFPVGLSNIGEAIGSLAFTNSPIWTILKSKRERDDQ